MQTGKLWKEYQTKHSRNQHNPAVQTVCEHVQSKCTWALNPTRAVWREIETCLAQRPGQLAPWKHTWTCDKNNFRRESTRKMAGTAVPQHRDNRFVQACAMEMHMDMWQKPHQVTRKFSRKNRHPKTGTTVLCESAQWKCTWTCDKNRVTRKFARKMPCSMNSKTSRHGLCATLLSRNAHGHITATVLREDLRQAWSNPGLNLYRETHQRGDSFWGNIPKIKRSPETMVDVGNYGNWHICDHFGGVNY